MTLPRMLLKRSTYLITRRCFERRFRLRPEEDVNALLDYLVGYAAEQTGVEIVAAVAMPNHVHMVVFDRDARLPEFMRLLCSYAARALNALHTLTGPLWELGSYSAVRLDTPGEVVDKIAYCLANPVKAGLVRTPEAWPGLITQVDTLGKATRTTARPAGYFFRAKGVEKRKGPQDRRPRGWKGKTLPETSSWSLCVPPGFEDAADLRRQVRAALEERLDRVEVERRREGLHGVVGKERLLARRLLDTPASTEERFRLNPRLAFKDWTRRAQVCGGWTAFQLAHRAAFERYCDGHHDEVFPAGTYRMRVHFGVRCSRSVSA